MSACAQDFYPLQILLNGAACYLRISLNLTAPVPNFTANGTLVEDSQSPITATNGQLTGTCTSQMKLLSACTSVVTLRDSTLTNPAIFADNGVACRMDPVQAPRPSKAHDTEHRW